MISDKQARDLIAAALASAADEESAEHWPGLTQEPPLTARIGKALEMKLKGSEINGWKINVVTQDIPDRGTGALEEITGADLYVGIEASRDGKRTTKGFLVQSKWAGDTSGQKKLAKQCRDMLARTSAAYVWFYGPEGITFLPAELVQQRVDRALFRGRPLAPELAKILECSKGDLDLGLPTGAPIRQALGGMLAELGVRTGIGISLKKRAERGRKRR